MSTHSEAQQKGFPFLGYLAALAAFIFGHWLATHGYEQTVEFFGPSCAWFILGLSMVGTVGFARLGYHRHHEHPRTTSTIQSLLVFALAASALLFAVGVGLSMEHLLKTGQFHLAERPWLFSIICVAGLLISSYLHARVKSGYDHVRDVEQPQGKGTSHLLPGALLTDFAASKHFEGMILFVSTPNQVPGVAGPDRPGEAQPAAARPGVRPPDNENQSAPDTGLPIAADAHLWLRDNKDKWFSLPGVSLKSDLKILEDLQQHGRLRWNWTPLLRAIKPHGALRKVVLVGSRDALEYRPIQIDALGNRADLVPGFKVSLEAGKGSLDYLPRCQSLLAPYLPAGAVSMWHEAVNFEDFNDLTMTLHRILKSEFSEFPKAGVVLDVTGGQKVASIAAAALTLNNEMRFQYVQTGKPFGVVPYDLINEELPGPHPHFPAQASRSLS